MKRKKGRTRRAVLLVLIVEVILIIIILFYIQMKPKIVKAVTVEAGTQDVSVDDFLKGSKQKGSFVTDMSTVDLNTPGTYEVQIKVGNSVQTSSLKVVDTTAPTATAVDQLVLKGGDIDAQTFVKDVNDITQVTVSYKDTPDFTAIGDQKVTLVLTDTSNNTSELTAKLTVLDVNKTVKMEAGSEMNITAADFVNDDKYDVSIETDLSTIDTNKPGTYEITLNINGQTATADIEVVDSAPPKAVIGDKQIWQGETPDAISFVTDMAGEEGLTAEYKNTPDFTLLGDQAVTIVLKDESGNETEQSAVLTIKKDDEAPVITGVSDKTVYIGETVSYKKGVTVTDNKDKKVDLKIDNSQVNLNKTGTYQVTYSATDSAGNSASVSATITVKESIISMDELNQMAQDILNDITTPDMSKEEIAYAIYTYTRSHIAYTGHSDKSDWVAEAYRGITNAVGDCFTYFAVSQELLNQAGIDNMGVTRVGGTTRHYWSMVNVGDGWYHFDSCPNKDHKKTFMMTDAEVEHFTEIRGNNYYTFDNSKYPATPEENPYE